MNFILKPKHIVSVAFFLMAMTNSYILFAQCPQNNFTVTGFQLRDKDGKIFDVTDEYELGEQVTGQLWVNFGGSTTNGYNMLMFYDVHVNGVRTADDQYDCLFSGIQVVQNVWVKVRDFTWNWGDVIEIKDIFMYWETGTVKPETTCKVSTKSNINSQCYGNPDGFTAAVPLYPKFDFESNGICNTTIQFTGQTIGGTPPFNYTYSWDFNNDNIIDSNLENPIYNFPATGTYPINLIVYDGVSTTTITKDIFIDPNFGIDVTIFPTKQNETSGIIYTDVTGGTPPYTYYWTGPDGYTSTSKDIFDLANGNYTLVVTDSNGCQQTVTYVLDIASVLGFTWNNLDLFAESDHVRISWSVSQSSEHFRFDVERSSRDATNFKTIGSITSTGAENPEESYFFKDTTLKAFEEEIYYRIKKSSETETTYSPVKLFSRKSTLKNNTNWHAFPNPSTSGDVSLKLLTATDFGQIPVTLEILNSGINYHSCTISVDSSGIIDLKEFLGETPKGLTLLRIKWLDQTETIKLIHLN